MNCCPKCNQPLGLKIMGLTHKRMTFICPSQKCDYWYDTLLNTKKDGEK